MYVQSFIAADTVDTLSDTNISGEETGRASSLFNTNRQVAASFGVALLGTVLFELLGQQPHPLVDPVFAFHIAFVVGAALGLIGILFAITIRNQDAAASLAKVEEGRGTTEGSREYSS